MQHATIFLTDVFSFLIHPFAVGLGYDVLKGNPRGSGECNKTISNFAFLMTIDKQTVLTEEMILR